jgi:hypothetical protein
MNAEQQKIFDSLREKIKKIISVYESEKEENNKLISEKEELVTKLIEREEEYKSLLKKYELLKLAKSFAGGDGGAHDAKIKINRMVREIDKCIALASK